MTLFRPPPLGLWRRTWSPSSVHRRLFPTVLTGRAIRAHRVLCSQSPPDYGLRRRQLREAFARSEQELEQRVQWEKLTEAERHIHQQHRRAVQCGHFTYDDPATGLRVVTRLRHFLKGSCCGNACRHCVYEHEAVPEPVRARRRFNSAFWVDCEAPNKEDEIKSDDPDDVDFV